MRLRRLSLSLTGRRFSFTLNFLGAGSESEAQAQSEVTSTRQRLRLSAAQVKFVKSTDLRRFDGIATAATATVRVAESDRLRLAILVALQLGASLGASA